MSRNAIVTTTCKPWPGDILKEGGAKLYNFTSLAKTRAGAHAESLPPVTLQDTLSRGYLSQFRPGRPSAGALWGRIGHA